MKSRTSLFILLAVVALTLLSGPVSAAIWHVDGTTSGDGTSWAKGFKTIAEAITDANALDEIWVKAGTYDITSQIQVNEAIGIYGGFAGDETERSQRNWVNNVTTIDGQDSTRILYITEEPTIDGFTLTNGYYDTTAGQSGGGAIFIGGIGSLNKTARISNCIISNNTVDADILGFSIKGGGAIYVGTGDPVFVNCLITNNSTNAYGGGANLRSGSPDFINCTISKNTALKGGGFCLQGVDGSPDLNAELYNCIVSGNTGTSDANDLFIRATGDPPQGGNNCSSDEIGTGTIFADPLFIYPDSDDFHLQAGSPCIDAGDSNSVPSDVSDLDGDGDPNEPVPLDLDANPRFIDDPDAANSGIGLTPILDIGAYEFGELPCGNGELPYPTGDINFDCGVDLIDYAIFTLCWLTNAGGPGWNPNCDLYADSTIDIYDLDVFGENWLTFAVHPPEPVGYWKMDDDANDLTVLDSSENGNNGTAQQDTSILHADGKIDSALTFNGIDDYIQIADSVPLSPAQEVTVCGWFYFNDTSENVGLIWKHNYNYALWTVSDTVRFAVWNSLSEPSRASFPTALLEAGWNFIAGVFDGTNSRLYLNGDQVGTLGASLTGGIRDRAGDLYIGQRPGEQYFDGKIDDVKIYDRTLTPAEITFLYNLAP